MVRDVYLQVFFFVKPVMACTEHRRQKCQAYHQDMGCNKIHQNNGRHLPCVLYPFWHSWSCRAAITIEQRVEKAEKTLTQMLQNAKAKFKVSGVMLEPQGTPAEKTVASVIFIKNFLHRLRTRFSEECAHLLEVADVRTFLTLVELRQVTDTPTVLNCAMNFVEAVDETLKRIAWPGYICFTREKQHYELPSHFSIKYEDFLPVPQEPTTFLNKEDGEMSLDEGLGNSRSEILSRKTKPVLSPFTCTCRKSHTKMLKNKL